MDSPFGDATAAPARPAEAICANSGPAVAPSPTEQIDLAPDQQRQQRFEASLHIETILGELGPIARAANLAHLHYFIELTRQEAKDQLQRHRPGR